MSNAATTWRIGPDRVLDLAGGHIMGILNITPDSFSDGGRFMSVETAFEHAASMIDQGATIIDIGGESTRPGADRVSAEAQCDRVIPVIEAIRARWDVALSVDTTRAPVAEAAIVAGADIINDVAAGTEDADMLPLAARSGCGLVLMHRLHAPGGDQWSDQWGTDPDYGGDVTGAVLAWLHDRLEVARQAGVDQSRICIDPGLGFGKSVRQNWTLIADAARFVQTGLPVLSAASRKSFIGAVTGQDQPDNRLAGSLAVTSVQAAAGIRLFRVHDAADHGRVMRAVVGHEIMS